MRSELAQGPEWNSDQVLEWHVLEYPEHEGTRQLIKDLNDIDHGLPALYTCEFDWPGFEWINSHDASQSVPSYTRIREE